MLPSAHTTLGDKMKSLLLSSVFLMALGSQAFATEYKCVADALQATDSDNYYNLSNQDVDNLLKESNPLAKRIDKSCTVEALRYRCVADGLEAINSDVFFNITKTEIESILSSSEDSRHSSAVEAVRRCGHIR
jgi:hypothetical protein